MILGEVLSIATSGVVGSVIGGVTNHLAIQMLFHPYEAKYIGKWKVPFTPGILPKRREELAVSLGKTVEEYLMTPEMLRGKLLTEEFQEKITELIVRKWEEFKDNEKPTKAYLKEFKLWDKLDELENNMTDNLGDRVSTFVSDLEDKELYQLIGTERITKIKSVYIQRISAYLLTSAIQYIESEKGELLIKNIIDTYLSDKGVFGGVVNFLVKDSKGINSKIRNELASVLKDNKTFNIVNNLLENELDKLIGNKLGAFMHVDDAKIHQLISNQVHSIVNKEERLNVKVTQQFPQIDNLVKEKFAKFITNKLMSMIDKNIEKALQVVDVAEIVKKQVDTFPVSKLEQLLLGISKREFKMITVFGFVMGGIIGVVQGLIQLLFY